MNEELVLPCSSVLSGSRTLCQRLVFRALARMPRGRLTLMMPDRSRVHFGARAHSTAGADGAPHAAIQVRDPRFFRRCVLHGDVGFGESYLAGEWDTPDLPGVIGWFVANLAHTPTASGSSVGTAGLNLLRAANRLAHRLRPNSRAIARRNIAAHYDLSNEFFSLWLGPTMMYSSARWRRDDDTLDVAQTEKNEMLCRRLRLRPGDHVLEIGTGWGGWAEHAARRHGCRITTLTLSQQQWQFARERITRAGLADRVEVRLQDYRALPAAERYDKIVSIEMLEAVGHDYLKDWCAVVSRALRPDGVMALQFITCPDARYAALRRGVDFIQKHVFPGSLLVSVNRLNELLSRSGGFVLHELEDFGPDYARTLRQWRNEFNARADSVRQLGFDNHFLRKWNYYLAYCEAAFAWRNISVVQTVHTRPNNLTL